MAVSIPQDLSQKFKFTNKLDDTNFVGDCAAWKYGFTSFTTSTWSEFLEVMKSPKHHYLLEQFRPNFKCKMYFDVEMEFKEQPTDEFQKQWLTTLLECIKTSIDSTDAYISNGSRLYKGGWKTSFHLTFPTIIVKCNRVILPLVKALNQTLPSSHKVTKAGKVYGCIDETVYKDNQCMRTVNAKKPPVKGVTSDDYLRPWDYNLWEECKFNDESEKLLWYEKSLITNVPHDGEMLDLDLPAAPQPLMRRPREPQEPRAPPPPSQPEEILHKARSLASRITCTTYEEWSQLGFALYTVFGGTDSGLYFFMSLWADKPMYDEAKARRCYRIALGKLGMGYLERQAARPLPGNFDQQVLLAQTSAIKTEIKKTAKDDIDKLQDLENKLQEISTAYLNQFFMFIIDEKPIMCRELPTKLIQYKFSDAANSDWPAIKRELNLWNTSVARRTFEGLDFDPKVDGNITDIHGRTKFNLWKGPAHPMIEDYDMDSAEMRLKPFLNHIKSILCDGNSECYEYVIKWCANAVQNPGNPNRVALVLQGDQGCGKGVFVQMFKDVVGEQYFYQVMDQANGLLGKFAPEGMESCLMCFVDEAFFPGHMGDVQKIKKLITETTRDIEKKYGARTVFKNFTNYIFASNGDYVVNFDPQERRFLVLKCNNRYSGVSNEETINYFSSLRGTSIEDLAQYLYRVNLTGFNPRQFPRTLGNKQQKQYTLGPIGQWLEKILTDGELEGLLNAADKRRLFPHTLFSNYQDWHKSTNNPARIVSVDTIFNMQFGQFLTRRGEQVPMFKKIRPANGDRKRVWQFPSIEEIKEQFATRMDCPDWFKDDCDDEGKEEVKEIEKTKVKHLKVPLPRRERSASPQRKTEEIREVRVFGEPWNDKMAKIQRDKDEQEAKKAQDRRLMMEQARASMSS